jgi:hypothetical protein
MTADPESLSLRDTARGVAIRGGALLAGGLLLSGWIAALAFRVASKAIHILLVLGLALIGVGVATYEVKKVEKRWRGPRPV